MTVVKIQWENVWDKSDRGNMVSDLPIYIGRSDLNDVVLQNKRSGVSRNHACVESKPDGFLVTDLKSTNGTYINGSKIGRGILTKDSALIIGSYLFQIEKAVQCRNETCQRLVADDGQFCPHCGDFLADAVTQIFDAAELSQPTLIN